MLFHYRRVVVRLSLSQEEQNATLIEASYQELSPIYLNNTHRYFDYNQIDNFSIIAYARVLQSTAYPIMGRGGTVRNDRELFNQIIHHIMAVQLVYLVKRTLGFQQQSMIYNSCKYLHELWESKILYKNPFCILWILIDSFEILVPRMYFTNNPTITGALSDITVGFTRWENVYI